MQRKAPEGVAVLSMGAGGGAKLNMAREKTKALRRRVYMALEQGPVGEQAAVVVDRALMALILVNLVAVTLESVPAIDARYRFAFELIEYF
jgi:voltage-gated potassium channel